MAGKHRCSRRTGFLCLMRRRLEPEANHPICRACRHHIIRTSTTIQEAANILGITRQSCHEYARKHRLRRKRLAKAQSTARNAERHVKTSPDRNR